MDERDRIIEGLKRELAETKNRLTELEGVITLQNVRRALTVIRSCHNILYRSADEREMLDATCRVIVEDAGYRLAWIGYKQHDADKTVLPVAHYGFGDDYPENIRITWGDDAYGAGPTGTAIRTEEPFICRDVHTDPKFEPWRAEAAKRGYASSIALPLFDKVGDIIGALNIYAAQPDAFDEMECSLLLNFSEILYCGINLIRARQSIIDENQIFIDGAQILICKASPDGYFKMVNPMFIKTVGYTADELLSRTFLDFIHPDDRESTIIEVEKQIKGLTTENFENRYICKDGSIKILSWRAGPVFPNGTIYASAIDVTKQKAIESEFVESQRIYHALFQNSLAVMFLIDANDLKIIDVNDAAIRFYGYTREEMLSFTMMDINIQSQDVIDDALGKVVKSRQGFFVFLHRKRDGSIVSVESYPTILNLNGRDVIFSIVHDQSEKLKIEHELIESKKVYQTIFNDSLAVMFLIDFETKNIIDANGAACKFYGYDHDNFIKMKITDLNILPYSEVSKAMSKVRDNTQNYFQMRHRLADGRIRVVEVYSGPFSSQGRIVLHSIIHDITDKVKAEEENNYKSRLLDIIFKHSLDCIVILDRDFNFIRVSDSYAKACQMEISEFTGRNYFDIFPSNFQTEAEEARDKKIVYSRSERPFVFLDHPELGVTYWNLGLAPILDRDGEIELFLFTLKDVTSERRYKDGMTELNKDLQIRIKDEVEKSRLKDKILFDQSRHAALEELLINIAHQWRQPLAAIAGIAQDAQDAYDHNELDRDYLERSVKSLVGETQYMSDTIDKYTLFFNRDNNKTRFKPAESIKNALFVMDAYFKGSDITIEKELDERCEIEVVQSDFSKVVLDIFANIKDVFEERYVTNGIIKIKLYRDATTGRVVLRIFNNGGGIEDENLNRIFDPYFTTKHKGRGVGLGLYTARAVIEKHMNGNIIARNVDDGVEFKIEV